VCLLHLLRNLPPPFHLSLHVAHLNHQFRTEAADEAFFVGNLAKGWGLPVTLSAQPVAQICKENGLSKQAGARQVRYAFLRETAKKAACQWIALGHTADDQAETFLMRMLRGSGVRGLRGIPERRDGGLIRPLMDCSRSEIMCELSASGLAFCNDPSNKQTVYLRNKVRHVLLPVLETYNPKIKEALHREATLLRAEDDLMHQSMLAQLPRLDVEVTAEAVSFCVASLQGLHLALQRRVLRWGIEQLQHNLNGIAFKHTEVALSQVLSGKNGNIYQLPQGLSVQKNGLKFSIFRGRLKEEENTFHFQESKCPIPQWGEAPFSVTRDFPHWNLRFVISSSSKQEYPFSACKASFDFDKISGPLFVRAWQRGDRFAPLGMGGRHKKLQDFFIDVKIKRAERHRIPILASSEGILWVIGHRIDARFCATRRSLRVFTIEVQKCIKA